MGNKSEKKQKLTTNQTQSEKPSDSKKKKYKK
jgi:hypothetical protein